jgi:small subunit ribosomal protein S1
LRAVAGIDRERWRDLFGRLRVGDVVEGTVAGLAGYGAFVQIGDAPGDHLFGDGLVHISELAPGRISRVTDVLRLGQRVRVRVIGLEPEQNRIRLSMRDVPPVQ